MLQPRRACDKRIIPVIDSSTEITAIEWLLEWSLNEADRVDVVSRMTKLLASNAIDPEILPKSTMRREDFIARITPYFKALKNEVFWTLENA